MSETNVDALYEKWMSEESWASTQEVKDEQRKFSAIPNGTYIVRFLGDAKIMRNKAGFLRAWLGVDIIEGQDGTVGRRAYSGFTFAPSEKSIEKLGGEGATKEFIGTLKRIATTLTFANARPVLTEEGVGEWLEQMSGRIAVIRIGYFPANERGDESNMIFFNSIKAVGDVVSVTNRNGVVKVLGTAAEVARKSIIAANLKNAAIAMSTPSDNPSPVLADELFG